MRGLVIFVVVGLLTCQGQGQMPPLSSMAMLGLGGGTGGMEMNMQDLLLAQSMGASGSGSGGSGGSSGFDPMSALMLSQGGMGGGEMPLPLMASLMADRGGNRQGQSAPTSIGARMAGMLGNSGSGITPNVQDTIWTIIQTGGHMQRIMDAVGSVNDRMQLQRDGLQGVNPMMQAMTCPAPRNCMPAFCETPERSYTPESFYFCPGCPNCHGRAGLFTSMMQRGRGPSMPGRRSSSTGSGGMDFAQNMLLMQAMQSGQMSPAMMAMLMSSSEPQTPSQPQLPQQPPRRPTVPQMPRMPSMPQMTGGMMMPSQWTPPPGFPRLPSQGLPNMVPPGYPAPPASGPPARPSSSQNKPAPTSPPSGTPNAPAVVPPSANPSAASPPSPPPEFLEAIRRLGFTRRQQRQQISNPSQGV